MVTIQKMHGIHDCEMKKEAESRREDEPVSHGWLAIGAFDAQVGTEAARWLLCIASRLPEATHIALESIVRLEPGAMKSIRRTAMAMRFRGYCSATGWGLMDEAGRAPLLLVLLSGAARTASEGGESSCFRLVAMAVVLVTGEQCQSAGVVVASTGLFSRISSAASRAGDSRFQGFVPRTRIPPMMTPAPAPHVPRDTIN